MEIMNIIAVLTGLVLGVIFFAPLRLSVNVSAVLLGVTIIYLAAPQDGIAGMALLFATFFLVFGPIAGPLGEYAQEKFMYGNYPPRR